MPVQRVRRIVRKVDPWTVLKVSLIFNAILALVFVLGTIIFWSVVVNAGLPEAINDQIALLFPDVSVNFDGQVYFRIVVLLAVIGTIVLTGMATVAAVIYNLISDLVGGIEVVVLEEIAVPHATKRTVTLPTSRRRRAASRKPPEVTAVRPLPVVEAPPPAAEPAEPSDGTGPSEPLIADPVEEVAGAQRTGT